jgi:hypothetical protein
MFLRWTVRRRRFKDGLHWDGHARLWREEAVLRAAVLVESLRVDGQPCQRTVAYLGAIDMVWVDPTAGAWKPMDPSDVAGYARNAAWERRSFWRQVRRRLAHQQALGLFTAAQRAAFEAQIAAVVPRPPRAELEATEAESAVILAAWGVE